MRPFLFSRSSACVFELLFAALSFIELFGRGGREFIKY